MPYIGKSPSAGVRQRYQYTATAGQTTFTGTDLGNLTLTYTDNNFVDVFQNGVLLKGGTTDYTATSGTSVVLTTGASVSDVIEIIVYDVFSVGNFFNRTDSDSRYALNEGGVVFNETSADVDFRVESNGNANMLFVDGGNDSVVIGHNDANDGSVSSAFALQTIGTDFNSSSIGMARFSANVNAPTIAFHKSRNASIGGDTVVQDDDEVGRMIFLGNDGTDFHQAARITALIDGTPGNDDMPGRLIFSTTADGANSPTERMRINSSGRVGIGTTDIDAPLDIVDGTEYVRISNTVSDDTTKTGGLAIRHRDNEEEDFNIINGVSGSSSNIVNIGGSDFIGSLNAATSISFFTTSTRTTVDGTVHAKMDRFAATDSLSVGRTAVGYNPAAASSNSRGFGLHVGGHRYYHPAMMVEDYDSSTSYATTLIQFYRNGSDCGEITATTSTTYSTSSDYRLKTDIQDMDSASETIKKLKPRKYKWKANENIDGYTNPYVNGFIAHEVQEVIPNANDMGIVTGTKDKTEEVENVVFDAKGAIAHLNVTEDAWKTGKADGTYASDTTWKAKHDKVKAQGIDYSRFTPILVKSLQEALARIETLEAEVAKLKG